MKKGTKIWLIVIVILGVLGGALCVSAFAMGFDYKDLSGMAEHGLFAFDSWLTELDEADEQEKEWSGLQGHHTGQSSAAHNKSGNSDSDFLEHLMVDMDFGSLTIKATDLEDIYLEVDDPDDEKYFEFNATESGITVSNCNEAFWIGLVAPKATLYIPDGIYFEYVELDIDAGSCSIETALDTVQLHVDVDAGEASIKDMYAEWLDMDCDAGSITFAGVAGTGGTVDVDAGCVELQISENSFEDYDYDIDVSAGKLVVNQHEFSGMDCEEYISNQASGHWQLVCDAGEINMTVNK